MEKAIKELLARRSSAAEATSPQPTDGGLRLPSDAIAVEPRARLGGAAENEMEILKAERDALESELSKQKEEYEAQLSTLRTELDELKGNYEWLLGKYRLKASKIFGQSSEKHMVDGQMAIENAFDEAEATADLAALEPEAEPETTTVTYERPKRYPGQKADKLAGLEERTVEYELPEKERNCPGCGEPLPELAPAVSRRVEVVPAKACVVKSVRHRYGPCKCGCAEDADDKMIDAPMPQPALPHSLATETAVAHVITQKYQFGLPLYRQQQQWKMLGVDISRQTMANWVVMAALTWLALVYGRLHEILAGGDIAMCDESPLQVLREPGRPATSKSYMWLFRTAPRAGPPIALFEYRTTRSSKVPSGFLRNFAGYLCTDGYAAYYSLPGIKNVSCWMHCRRGFADALKSLPAQARGKPCLASEGLRFCNDLYKIERGLRQSTDEERHAARLEKSAPLLAQFKAWLDCNVRKTGANSHIGKAIRYALNYWATLNTFLEDGRLEIDNGASERSIKNFVIGRKGFLFANTPDGAKASAISYSIVETAKENGLKPFEYLVHVLEALPNVDVADQSAVDALLPWSESIPDACRQRNEAVANGTPSNNVQPGDAAV